jgi:hypothetical protein
MVCPSIIHKALGIVPSISQLSGTGSTLSILFWAYKLGFDIGILERTWDWGRVDNFDSADGVA